MADHGREPRPKYKRRKLIVNRKQQMMLIVPVLGALLATALVGVAANMMLPSSEVFGKLTGDQVRTMLVRVNIACLVSTFVAVGLILVVISHRVVGPSMVMEGTLRGMAKGEFDRRTQIRKKDYLQGLSQALTELNGSLRRRHVLTEEFVSQLRDRVDESDLVGIKELLDDPVFDFIANAANSATSDRDAMTTAVV